MKPHTINAICQKILNTYGDIQFESDYQIPRRIDQSILKEFGFGYIGKGASRIAFGNNHYVIKIGNPDDNAKEISACITLDRHPELKYTKVPIFKYIELSNSLSINITARCRKPRWPISFNHKLRQIHETFRLFYADSNERNIGMFGDSLVMLDLNYPYAVDPDKQYVDKWKSLINFEAHKQAYDARVNKLKLVA